MVAEVVRISARQLLTTADHANLALQRAPRPRVGKTAHRARSTVTHVRLVTHVTHAMLAQRPVATSVATGAQHLLLAAATFSAMTVILVILVTRTSLAQPVLSAAQPLLGARAMVERLVVSKIVRLALSIVTHVRLATTVRHALSIVTHAHRVIHVTVEHLVVGKIARLVLSIVTHAQLVIHAMVTHVRLALLTVTHVQHLALSTAQNHADHASSTTALASSTATTAMTAPTVVQTALTV